MFNIKLQNYIENPFRTDFLKELEADYKLCRNYPERYRKKVGELSGLFNLKGRAKLMGNLYPIGFTGEYDKTTHIIIFGINPGYGKHNAEEEKEKAKSWRNYVRFRKSAYKSFFKRVDHGSRYYRAFSLLFSGLLDGYNNEKGTQWDIFQQHITNLNLLPYHSRAINLPSKFSIRQWYYLTHNLWSMINFVLNYKPKLFVFDGKPWYGLLIKHRLIHRYKKRRIKGMNIYFFTIEGIPCVLFDKFFSLHYYGLKDKDRRIKIPKIIAKNYPTLFSSVK